MVPSCHCRQQLSPCLSISPSLTLSKFQKSRANSMVSFSKYLKAAPWKNWLRMRREKEVRKEHFLYHWKIKSTEKGYDSSNVIWGQAFDLSNSFQHLSLPLLSTTCYDLPGLPIPKAPTVTNYIYCLAESLDTSKSLFETHAFFCCLCKNFRSIKQQ